MIVIARNNGPLTWRNSNVFVVPSPPGEVGKRSSLKEGKSYEVIGWAHYIQPYGWIEETKDFINPKEPKFFIRIINEDGVDHNYWNDYFLSSEEMRDIKIDNILK